MFLEPHLLDDWLLCLAANRWKCLIMKSSLSALTLTLTLTQLGPSAVGHTKLRSPLHSRISPRDIKNTARRDKLDRPCRAI
jgi:hypothetical protein